MAANTALHLVLVLPKEHLPGRNARVDDVYHAAVQKAPADLSAAADERIAKVFATAVPGRDFGAPRRR